MDHVVVRELEHLTGTARAPGLGYAIEMRDRPGPAHKHGAFPDDTVWVQVKGGLMVAKARVAICWVGEYSSVGEIRARTRGSLIHDIASFWAGRPRYGYAAVAELSHDHWVDPFWAGPRSYGYEWIVLENDSKHSTWLDHKPAPRTAGDLAERFKAKFSG